MLGRSTAVTSIPDDRAPDQKKYHRTYECDDNAPYVETGHASVTESAEYPSAYQRSGYAGDQVADYAPWAGLRSGKHRPRQEPRYQTYDYPG